MGISFPIDRIVFVFVLALFSVLASSEHESLHPRQLFRDHHEIKNFEMRRSLSASNFPDVVALSPFIIEFHLRNGAVLPDEIKTAENVVYSYLEAYMTDQFSNATNDDLQLIDFQTKLSSHSHSGKERNILVLEFNSTATFASVWSEVPTKQELDSVLATAFQSGRKIGFLELLQFLPEDNFFRGTRDIQFAFDIEGRTASTIRFGSNSLALSHYRLSFVFQNNETPSPLNFTALERVTTIYLASSILRESGLSDTDVEDFSTLVIKHWESERGYVVEFESVIESAPERTSELPSIDDLDAIRSMAFSQKNIYEYKELLKSLPAGNVFAETVVVVQEGEIIQDGEVGWSWGGQEITLLVLFILGFIMLVCGMYFYLMGRRRVRPMGKRRLERHPSLENMQLQIPSTFSATPNNEEFGSRVMTNGEVEKGEGENDDVENERFPSCHNQWHEEPAIISSATDHSHTKSVAKDGDQGYCDQPSIPEKLTQTTTSKINQEQHLYRPPRKSLGLHQLYSDKYTRHNGGVEADQHADIAGRYELETEVSSVTGISYLLYKADRNKRGNPFSRNQRGTALKPRHRMINFTSDHAVCAQYQDKTAAQQDEDETIISQLEHEKNWRSGNPASLEEHETDDNSIISEVSSLTGITNFLNRTISFRRKAYGQNRDTIKRKKKCSYYRVVKERPRTPSEDETVASSEYLDMYDLSRIRD